MPQGFIINADPASDDKYDVISARIRGAYFTVYIFMEYYYLALYNLYLWVNSPEIQRNNYR